MNVKSPEPMLFGLPAQTSERIKKIFEKNAQVEEVILFGSRAKKNFKEGSDIDLAVKGTISFKDFLMLRSRLDDLNLPYTIDLVQYSSIEDKDVIEHIQRVGITFYKKAETR